MAFSLLAGANENPFVLTLAVVELLVFLIVFSLLLRRRSPPPRWLVPLVALGGFAVAGYLAYVELTLSDAVCGVVGNCNIVQQSSYAQIFSVPVGVLGVVGYTFIIVLWLPSLNPERQRFATTLLRLLVMGGVAFSIYLTFLEPFVIGATCIWCLTSAVMMLLLLWLLTPSAEEVTSVRPVRAT